jgi:hypothetical protein
MIRFVVTVIIITLIVSCSKTDTPPNSPVVAANWSYVEYGVDYDSNGVFTSNEITNLQNQYIRLQFNTDGSGNYTGDLFQPLTFQWNLQASNILQLSFPIYVPYLPRSLYHIDSLTTNTMYLADTFKGRAEFYHFVR